jgi:hypothetical protein
MLYPEPTPYQEPVKISDSVLVQLAALSEIPWIESRKRLLMDERALNRMTPLMVNSLTIPVDTETVRFGMLVEYLNEMEVEDTRFYFLRSESGGFLLTLLEFGVPQSIREEAFTHIMMNTIFGAKPLEFINYLDRYAQELADIPPLTRSPDLLEDIAELVKLILDRWESLIEMPTKEWVKLAIKYRYRKQERKFIEVLLREGILEKVGTNEKD